jgi:hypothetical protein
VVWQFLLQADELASQLSQFGDADPAAPHTDDASKSFSLWSMEGAFHGMMLHEGRVSCSSACFSVFSN